MNEKTLLALSLAFKKEITETTGLKEKKTKKLRFVKAFMKDDELFGLYMDENGNYEDIGFDEAYTKPSGQIVVFKDMHLVAQGVADEIFLFDATDRSFYIIDTDSLNVHERTLDSMEYAIEMGATQAFCEEANYQSILWHRVNHASYQKQEELSERLSKAEEVNQRLVLALERQEKIMDKMFGKSHYETETEGEEHSDIEGLKKQTARPYMYLSDDELQESLKDTRKVLELAKKSKDNATLIYMGKKLEDLETEKKRR